MIDVTVDVPALLFEKLKVYAKRDSCSVEDLILRQLEIRVFQEDNR